MICTCRLEAPLRDFQMNMILLDGRDAGGAYDERKTKIETQAEPTTNDVFDSYLPPGGACA